MAAKVLTALARASSTLTLGTGDTQLPHADDTTIVGTVTYVWKASVTTTANQVKIGTTMVGSIANLVAAINNSGGTGYGSLTTANPDATAAVGSTTTMVAYARTSGLIGNNVPTAGTMTHGSWGAALMAGGVGQLEELVETAVAALKNMNPNSQTLAYLEGMTYDLAL